MKAMYLSVVDRAMSMYILKFSYTFPEIIMVT